MTESTLFCVLSTIQVRTTRVARFHPHTHVHVHAIHKFDPGTISCAMYNIDNGSLSLSLFLTASRLPRVDVGEQMISKPASRMGLFSPTSRVAAPRAGSDLEADIQILSRGMRVSKASYGGRERERGCG